MSRALEAQSFFLEVARASSGAWQRALLAHRRAHGLEAVPTFLLPVFLDEAAAAPLAAGVEALCRALVRLQRAWFDDGRFREELALPVAGLEALAIPASEAAVSCRFDVALDPARPLQMQVLEVQVGDASGAGWADLFWLGMEPLLAAAGGGFELRCPSLLEGHRRMTLDLLSRRATEGEPVIAFACARDSFVRSDHEAMATLYRRLGTRAVVVDPREIEVTAAGLSAGGLPVGLLVRDTVDEYLQPPFLEDTARLREHLAAGLTPVVPPFRDALLDDKRALALLSCGAADDLLDDDERRAVAAHLPWTRVLDDAAHAREGRVVKPADGYGGFGVVLGDEVDERGWQQALAEARGRPSIVQARQTLPRLRLPSAAGAFDDEERWLCVSLWCHGGRFSGGYARAGGSPVVNVHQGGGLIPLVFVR